LKTGDISSGIEAGVGCYLRSAKECYLEHHSLELFRAEFIIDPGVPRFKVSALGEAVYKRDKLYGRDHSSQELLTTLHKICFPCIFHMMFNESYELVGMVSKSREIVVSKQLTKDKYGVFLGGLCDYSQKYASE